MDANSTEWLDRALAGTPVWDMGQLGDGVLRALNRAVRAGKISKARTKWMFLARGATRSVWFREDNVPGEVLRDRYCASRRLPPDAFATSVPAAS